MELSKESFDEIVFSNNRKYNWSDWIKPTCYSDLRLNFAGSNRVKFILKWCWWWFLIEDFTKLMREGHLVQQN